MTAFEKAMKIGAAVLFLAGVIGMLMPSNAIGPPNARSFDEISIAGHILVFFLGAYLFNAFHPGFAKRAIYIQALLLLSAAFLAGAFLEGLQSFIPGRTATLRDVIANMTGTMVFLSLKNLRNVRRYFLLHAPSALITIILLLPFFKAFADECIAKSQFPLLAGFETPYEANRFIRGSGRFGISDEYAFHGAKSLKVRLGTQTYSGIAMEHIPKNWKGYSQLQFAVYNPQEKEVTLHTRIHDTHHAKSGRMIYADRFNRTFSLPPEKWTVIAIPLKDVKNAPRNRKMDMKEITNIGFFVAREPEPLTLFLDDIRLE